MTRDEKLHRALEMLEEIDLDVPVLDCGFIVAPIRKPPVFEEFEKEENVCDTCGCPEVHKCFDLAECYENLPEGECCVDNLEKQVGEICFKYDVAEKYAKVIVEVLRKERKKNESMYICR